MSDLLVKLQIYEGPLDLLLHLIKKNEVDLDDIPVALITAQYLAYLDLMESMNVEVAADFLVMAATLTQIKSRLLLPHEKDEDDDIDPTDEIKASIIDPLLEHMRRGGVKDFKDAAEALRSRQLLNSDVFVRGGNLLDDEEFNDTGEGLADATLFDLVDAFRRLAEKKPETRTLKFVVETKTIGERIGEIRQFLKDRKSGTFEEICGSDRSQGELVLSFLAVLELARTGFLRLYQNVAKSCEMNIFLANPDADIGDLDQLDY
ncbi:hypothetical protein C4J81_01355 [Deltaproteobacteria bacterium Smac51]|nr:hypothetical protein C4J81_01355 [Deltaproteobacteria bacterium Smac51]